MYLLLENTKKHLQKNAHFPMIKGVLQNIIPAINENSLNVPVDLRSINYERFIEKLKNPNLNGMIFSGYKKPDSIHLPIFFDLFRYQNQGRLKKQTNS